MLAVLFVEVNCVARCEHYFLRAAFAAERNEIVLVGVVRKDDLNQVAGFHGRILEFGFRPVNEDHVLLVVSGDVTIVVPAFAGVGILTHVGRAPRGGVEQRLTPGQTDTSLVQVTPAPRGA